MRAAPVGSRKHNVGMLIETKPSAKTLQQRRERDLVNAQIDERSRVLRLRASTRSWLEDLDPLQRENARLLIFQHEADIRSADRWLGDADESPMEAANTPSSFLGHVAFDRADDMWMYYAGQGVKRKMRNRGQ